MRRAELGAGIALLFILGVVALMLGLRHRAPDTVDARRSTFNTAPAGASALAQGLARLDVNVTRLRRRVDSADLASAADSGSIFIVLSHTLPLSSVDAGNLAERVRHGGHLLVSGTAAGPAMHCFGVQERWLDDSARAVRPGRAASRRAPWVTVVLAALTDSTDATPIDSARREFWLHPACASPVTRFDTVLVSAAGAPVALRAHTGRGTALIVADGRLFSNERLRNTEAGEFALGLIAGHFRRAVFDEYHQGFGPSGSLAGAVLAWSRRSPWGWAAWQLSIVGLLALAASAVRFAPARRVIERRRRSPLEHVRALAIALAAARGHHVAIATQIHGLRRRLSRGRAPARTSPAPWLEELARNARSSRAIAAVATLRSLTQGPQPADAVLRAANAVEDVWEELKP